MSKYIITKNRELYDEFGFPKSVTEEDGYDINGFPATRQVII